MLQDDPYAPNCCCVCGKPVRGSYKGVPAYFCAKCLREWQPAVDAKVAWLHQLRLWESARRKRRNRHWERPEWKMVSLEEKFQRWR